MSKVNMPGKIAVLGTGANGGCIAADLVNAGLDVTLIDQWPLNVETMRSCGIRVVMPGADVTTRVNAHHLHELASLNRTFDVVLLAVKAYDTRWACELIKPHLSPDGMLIGMQNAMTAPTIREIVGPERTLGCAYELSSEMFTPGHIKRNVDQKKTWIGIGALDPVASPRLGEFQKLLSHVGRCDIVSDILSAKWTKLVVNAMCLGPCAVVGLTVLDAIELPGFRDMLIDIGNEAMRAGQDLGYPMQPIFGLTAQDLAGSNNPASILFDKLVRDIGPGRGKNTVLQDLLKGRASEVEMINGLVVEESRKRGRPAPANQRIAEITRRIERGELNPGPGNMALVEVRS